MAKRDEEEQGGMFSNVFGLPYDRTETLKRNRARDFEAAGKMGEEMEDEDDAGLISAGARIGEALRQWKDPNRGLSDEEQRKFKALEATNSRLQTIDRELWNNMNMDQREELYTKVAYEEAYRAGLPEVGQQLYDQYQVKKLAIETKKKELRKVGLELDEKEVEVGDAEDAIERKKEEHRNNVYKTTYNPTTGEILGEYKVDNEGNAIAENGEIAFLPGEWTWTDPKDPRRGAASGKSLLTAPERREVTGLYYGAQEMMFSSKKLANLLDSSVSETGTLIGWGGDLARFATNLSDNVQGVVTTMGKAAGLGWKQGGEYIEDAAGNRTLIRNKAGIIKKYDSELTEAVAPLAEQGIESERAKLLVMDLAYALMRAEEPGAGRYSDDDFVRAMALAGEGLADPAKLKTIIWDRLSAIHNKFEIRVRGYGQEEIDKLLPGDVGQKAYYSALQEVEDLFLGKKRAEPKYGTPRTRSSKGFTISR